MSKEEQHAENPSPRNHPNRRMTQGQVMPCEECGMTDWSEDSMRGEVICNSCGLVVEEGVMDPGAEWTNHDRTQDRSRVGAPMTYRLADKGLNTSIAIQDLRSGRHGMSSRARRDWRRRRVIDERSKTRQSRERNLVKANQFIRDRSGLPVSLQEEAARLYRRLSGQGYVTGRSIAGVTAACTYLVAREEEIPRQIPELADQFSISEKELSRVIRQVSRILNMHKISSPANYFDRFISDLQLPPNIRLQVDHLWNRIKPHPEIWQGKKPMGVAAALIYKASNESSSTRTQAEICKIANVSEVTLRGLIRMINGMLKQLGEVSEQ